MENMDDDKEIPHKTHICAAPPKKRWFITKDEVFEGHQDMKISGGISWDEFIE
jgi:hypothetical protein